MFFAKINRGFSLVEIIIYTALLGLVMTGFVLVTQTAIIMQSRTRNALILEENIRFAQNRIVSLIHQASEITTPTANSSGSNLILTMDDQAKNPTTISVSGGVIYITEGNSPSENLTSSEIDITNLNFTGISGKNGTAAGAQIKISGQLKNAAVRFQTSLTVQNTSAVRR